MVEENEFFYRAGVEFSIVAQLEIDRGLAVRLTRRIQTKDVGLIFLGTGPGVFYRRGEEKEEGQQ